MPSLFGRKKEHSTLTTVAFDIIVGAVTVIVSAAFWAAFVIVVVGILRLAGWFG